MSSRLRSLGLLGCLMAAASASFLINCSTPQNEDEDPPLSEDEINGVNNALGLSLLYDEATSKVSATLKDGLRPGEKLYIRVRRGVITHDSEANLDCSQLSEAPPIESGKRLADGEAIFQGPEVSQEIVKLIGLYNDERWYTGDATPEMKAEAAKGPDPIVEACVVRDGKVRARLLTNLAYAWDRGSELAEDLGSAAKGTRGGAVGGIEAAANQSAPASLQIQRRRDAGAGRSGLREGVHYNTIDYANLCVQELGEIPFFKKIRDGKYETFDCRDFVGSNGRGSPQAIPGVEGKVIPLTVNDAEQTTCSPGQSSVESYDCVDKCDRGMWLTASSHTRLGQKAACQPGVTVTTGKNDKGTNWILLCRKVEDTGVGMLKTKKFNDIAIIGSNPETGKTCFFQNKEDVGNDGSRVVHPADTSRSSAIWPSDPSSYCTKNCHAADAFVHSPWIDQAVRGDGKTIVPKMGEQLDYPVSDLTKPYSLLNGPSQGFELPQQLVSEPVAPCTTCHRVAGASFAEFADWATGKGDAYYSKITPRYKEFAKSHWMPPRLDGLNEGNFDASVWGKAVDHIRSCLGNSRPGPDCQFAPIPATR